LENQLYDDCDIITKDKVKKNIDDNIKTPGKIYYYKVIKKDDLILEEESAIDRKSID